MKAKVTEERDRFDRVMDGLLAVPYRELQDKIEKEKKAKASSRKTPSRVEGKHGERAKKK